MTRRISKVVALAAMVCMVFSLCGCTSSYKPETKAATVDAPTIATSGTLNVGVNANNAPFSANVSGKVVGLDVDIAAALASEMGLKLNIVDVGTDPEAALANKTVDVVMNLEESNSTYSCWMSNPYMDTAVALFSADANASVPASTSTDTIATQASSMSAWEVSSQMPKATMDTTTDLKTAFSDLSSGQANFVAADAVIGSYVAYTSDTKASIIGLMQKQNGYCIGVDSANTDLRAAVESALATLTTNGNIGVIEAKWLGKSLDLSNVTLTSGAASGSDNKQASDGATDTDAANGDATDADAVTTDNSAPSEVGSNAVAIPGSTPIVTE